MPAWNTVTVQIDGQTLVQSPVSFGGTEVQHEVGSGWVKFHATDYAAMAAVNIGSHVKTTISTSVGLTTFVVNEFIVDEIPQTTGDGHFVTIRGQDRLVELDYRPVKWPISHEVTGTIRSDNLTDKTCRVDFDSPADDAQPDGYYDGWSIRTSGGSIGTIGDAAGGDWEGFLTTLNNIVLDTEWKPAAPAAGETCVIYGVLPSLTDVSDIIAYAPDWSLEVGSATATTSGTYDGEVVEESVLDLLRQTAEQSGEYFERVESEQRIYWSSSISPAGHPTYLGDVVLTSSLDYTRIDNDWQYGVIKRLTKTDFTQQKVTRIRPYGAGLGSSRLTLSSLEAGFTPASGYSIVADEGGAFLVHDASEAGGDYVLKTKSFPWIGPTNDSTPAAQAAASTLYQAAYQWLREQVSNSETVEVECVCHVPLRPNQFIRVVYDGLGMNIDQVIVILSVERTFDANQGYLIQTIKGVYRHIDINKIGSYGGSFRGGQQLVFDYLKQIKTILAHANSPGGAANFGSFSGGKILRLGTTAETLATLYDVTANIQEIEMDLQAANTVLASPDGSIGSVSFRSLVEADLPELSPSFLTLATSTQLANERVLTAGTGISLTDNGANGTLVISRDSLSVSDIPIHDIISKHSYSGGSALDVVGLSAPSTVAMLSPSSDPGAAASLLKTANDGLLELKRLNVGTGAIASGTSLNVEETFSSSGTGANFNLAYTQNGANIFGAKFRINSTPTSNNTDAAAGFQAQAIYSGGVNTDSIIGAEFQWGIGGDSIGGTIGNGRALFINQPANQGLSLNHSVTRSTGVEISNMGAFVGGSGSPSITNSYGLKISSQSGATGTSYAISTGGGQILFNDEGTTDNAQTLAFGAGAGTGGTGWLFGIRPGAAISGGNVGAITMAYDWNPPERLSVGGNIIFDNELKTRASTNMVLTPGASDIVVSSGKNLKSSNHTAGASGDGWELDSAGDLEAQEITARQNLNGDNLILAADGTVSSSFSSLNITGGSKRVIFRDSTIEFLSGSSENAELRVNALEIGGTYATSSGTATESAIRPNANHTSSNVTGGEADIDDDPDSPDTGNYAYNSTGAAAHKFFGLEATDASFVGWGGFYIKVHVTPSGFTADRSRLFAQFFQSDESTALTNEVLLADESTSGLVTVYLGYSTGGKTEWDSARLRLRWSYNDALATQSYFRADGSAVFNSRQDDGYLSVKGTSVTTLLSAGNDQVTVGSDQRDQWVDSATIFNVVDGSMSVTSEGKSAGVNLWCYNNGSTDNFPAWRSRASRGTRSDPSASQAGDILGRFGGGGYGYGGFSPTSRAFFQFLAGENFTSTSQGAYATIFTTANGSTSSAERFRVTDVGISTNGGANEWKLGAWTSNADAAINGYVTVTINGVATKLATIA